MVSIRFPTRGALNFTIKKTLYQTVNIIVTEAELFAIRYGISQAIQVSNISCITIINDSIHMAQKIFDSTIHSFQPQLIAIFKDLRLFFNKHSNNSIEFLDCSSNEK